jgi:hypothetical protein
MTPAEIIGSVLCTIGGATTALNFYLSFLRYPLYRLLGGARERYRWPSGVPVFGSLLMWIGAGFLWTRPVAMWSVLGLSLLDTAGLHVFAAVMAWLYFRRQ